MARNPHVEQRLAGIRKQLLGGYHAGGSMSSATKGNEREAFIDNFMSQVFPPTFRFGTGDATDSNGNKSGQLDVVIEFPFAPSLPTLGSSARHYLAESVAAVIEVKSDLEKQWDEVVRTAKGLRPVTRLYAGSMVMGLMTPYIPLFAVGYAGWKQLATLQAKVAACPEVSGAMIIEPGLFASSQDFGGVSATGDLALWGFIRSLHVAIDGVKAATSDPIKYAV